MLVVVERGFPPAGQGTCSGEVGPDLFAGPAVRARPLQPLPPAGGPGVDGILQATEARAGAAAVATTATLATSAAAAEAVARVLDAQGGGRDGATPRPAVAWNGRLGGCGQACSSELQDRS